jgi:hypothetical protein
MNMIDMGGEDAGPQINAWPDGGGTAVITWQAGDGQVHEQEVSDKRDAVNLLRQIAHDDQLSLIGAQLRRRGTGPAS